MSTSSNLGQTVSGEIKSRTTWGIFLGILLVALGILLMYYPLATATITTFVFGCILVVAGAVDIFLALRSNTAGNFFLRLLLGAVYAFAGILLLMFPTWGVAVLTVVLGIVLLFEAGLAAYLGFQIRPISGWGWFIFDAVITAILGILILAHWPQSAVWAIGTLVGAAVLVRGITRIAVSAGLKKSMRQIDERDVTRPRAA